MALVGALIGLVILAALGLLAVLFVQGKAPPSGNSEYVALGSSFGAGPGVIARAPGSPLACLRSDANYAHLLARWRHLDLTDMTCSGAVTRNVLEGGQFFQGAQLAAVKPTTKLVTITVGGNDVSYLANLFAWSCAREPGRVPLIWKLLGSCKVTPPAAVDTAFSSLLPHMTEIARRVRAVAPKARVIYVDYTTVLPDRGVCQALPITGHEANMARAVAGRLKAITAAAARDTGSDLVQASRLTHGHDVCSPHPWVYGFQLPSNPLAFGPLAYHPREQAMQAIASAINRDLSAGTRASPAPTPLPAAKPAPGPTGATTRPMGTPLPQPSALYSQEQIGQAKYELVNNVTEQFVSVTADGVHAICSRGVHARCTNAVIIGATMYSGNTNVTVSPRQFALRSSIGVIYTTAPGRQAKRVVQPSALLARTVLTADDDGDYVSGSLVFLVPARPGRFSLLWQGQHVATFVTTARGKLYERR